MRDKSNYKHYENVSIMLQMLMFPFEAESVAFVVSNAVGNIDTSDYSFGYIAGWSAGKDADELRNSMETIKIVSSSLINDIEFELKNISLERENAVTYEIYQLKDDLENRRDLAYESIDHLNMMGMNVDRDNYKLVYTGNLEEGESLEDLYTRFNIDHPEGFKGHSMSVSDVIVTKGADGEQAHFVDSVGMTAVTVFLMDQSLTNSNEAAVVVGNNFIEAHRCDEGIDYSVYSPDMKLIDGGVIENTTMAPVMAINEIINNREITGVIECLKHDSFCDNVEKANRIEVTQETRNATYKQNVQVKPSGHDVQKSENKPTIEQKDMDQSKESASVMEQKSAMEKQEKKPVNKAKTEKKSEQKKSLKQSLNEKKEKVAAAKTVSPKQKSKTKGEER